MLPSRTENEGRKRRQPPVQNNAIFKKICLETPDISGVAALVAGAKGSAEGSGTPSGNTDRARVPAVFGGPAIFGGSVTTGGFAAAGLLVAASGPTAAGSLAAAGVSAAAGDLAAAGGLAAASGLAAAGGLAAVGGSVAAGGPAAAGGPGFDVRHISATATNSRLANEQLEGYNIEQLLSFLPEEVLS